MTVRIPPTSPHGSSEVFTIDFRETAPASANNTMYHNNPKAARWGGLASGVPGELRGLEEAHRRWGTLPWSTLVQPSVDLASGWIVSLELERRIQVCHQSCHFDITELALKNFRPLMLDNPDWKAIFAPEGDLLRRCDLIKRTNLSRTLATIASHGADAFYKVSAHESHVIRVVFYMVE